MLYAQASGSSALGCMSGSTAFSVARGFAKPSGVIHYCQCFGALFWCAERGIVCANGGIVPVCGYVLLKKVAIMDMNGYLPVSFYGDSGMPAKGFEFSSPRVGVRQPLCRIPSFFK